MTFAFVKSATNLFVHVDSSCTYNAMAHSATKYVILGWTGNTCLCRKLHGCVDQW